MIFIFLTIKADNKIFIALVDTIDMTFSDSDKMYMRLALNEAKVALKRGDYPIGAVLVIDGMFVDKLGNHINSNKDFVSHAETLILHKNSALLKDAYKTKGSNIVLYSTLEPCLMCLSTSILSKVSRIVYSCRDPHGGATKLGLESLPGFYTRNFPKVEGGLFKEDSFDMMYNYMKDIDSAYWKRLTVMFKEMRDSW